LRQRLNSYALAASAAGVGVLALAQPVEGKIIYTRSHVKITNGTVLDLNHDGKADFIFRTASSEWSAGAGVRPVGVNGVVGRVGWVSAYRLPNGERIGAKRAFSGTFIEGCSWNTDTFFGCHGDWHDASGNLGLKFRVHGEAHYGWARLNVKVAGSRITAVLTGYAYETIPNKPIIAGKAHGKDVITLQDASLGHLARGTSAIPAWRQKEQ